MEKTTKVAEVKAKKFPMAGKKREKKAPSLQKQKAKMGWIFVAPFLLGFFLIYLPMILQSLQLSFTEMKILAGGGYELEYVGWKNYQEAFTVDTQFSRILFENMRGMFINIPAVIIFSLFMAILLNQKMKGRAVFRAIFFIPVIVSTGIIESIDAANANITAMESLASGSVMEEAETANQLISFMDIRAMFRSININLAAPMIDTLANLANDVYNIINKSGVQMLIFLAGLQSISPAIYESCYIDGASAWETFWKITFPMISPMILVNAIYTIIDSFTSNSNTVMKHISTVYNQPKLNVRATAMAWIYFVVLILLIAAVTGIISLFVFYQRRDEK